jgi:hypothetical protein
MHGSVANYPYGDPYSRGGLLADCDALCVWGGRERGARPGPVAPGAIRGRLLRPVPETAKRFRRASDLAAIVAEPGIAKSRPPDPAPKTRGDQVIKVQTRFLAHCGRPDTFAILGFDQGAIATERITANKRIHEAPGVPPPRIVLSPDTARDAISSREGSIDDERCIFHLRNANRYRLAKTKKRPPHLYANEPVSPLSADRWRCARCGLKRPCETVEIPTRALSSSKPAVRQSGRRLENAATRARGTGASARNDPPCEHGRPTSARRNKPDDVGNEILLSAFDYARMPRAG